MGLLPARYKLPHIALEAGSCMRMLCDTRGGGTGYSVHCSHHKRGSVAKGEDRALDYPCLRAATITRDKRGSAAKRGRGCYELAANFRICLYRAHPRFLGATASLWRTRAPLAYTRDLRHLAILSEATQKLILFALAYLPHV